MITIRQDEYKGQNKWQMTCNGNYKFRKTELHVSRIGLWDLLSLQWKRHNWNSFPNVVLFVCFVFWSEERWVGSFKGSAGRIHVPLPVFPSGFILHCYSTRSKPEIWHQCHVCVPFMPFYFIYRFKFPPPQSGCTTFASPQGSPLCFLIINVYPLCLSVCMLFDRYYSLFHL